MRHPPPDVVRRLVTAPAGVADPDRAHVAQCPSCLGALEEATVATASAGPASPAARTSRRLARPAVAAAAVALALTGASAAAANDWLPVFQTEAVTPVRLTPDDLVALPDLSAYGDVRLTGDPAVHEVADAAAAARETGLDVPEVAALPRGITGGPVTSVGAEASATFTFSAERAARAAAQAGESLPPVPPGLDGSAVRLSAGPGAVQVWSSASGAPGLLVGRAVAPTASTAGVDLDTARDYLLALPGLPDEVAAQLRAVSADGSTLPLPVPDDQVRTSSAQVDGRRATVVTSRDGSLSGVVWVDDGVVTVVAGSLDDDELLAVARGLR